MSNLLQTLLEPCAAKIEYESEARAKQIALSEYSDANQFRKLVVWSDGSHRNTGCGIAIAWRIHYALNIWNDRTFKLDPMYDNDITEFFAFSEAVKLAWQYCKQDSNTTTVIIYTDSQSVLLHTQDFHNRSPSHRARFVRQLELAELKLRVKEMCASGIQVVFRWVPGHSSVPGNVHVDMLAGMASDDRSRFSAFEFLQHPESGYLETPPTRRPTRRKHLQPQKRKIEVRRGRIEKIVTSRRSPAVRLYNSRLVQAIKNIEKELAQDWLSIVDKAVDEQLS